MRNLIQVAGIIDVVEADLLVSSGVDWLGFPLRLPVHAEDLSDIHAATIIRSLRPASAGVLITYLDKADAIAGLCRFLGTRHVQVHGDISLAELSRLNAIAPRLRIIKSLVVRDANVRDLEQTVRLFSPQVDAFITDTFDPVTGASGATGKTHDWRVSRRLVEISPRPVILAGGLTPSNVLGAILAVRPAGVDVHTGVEGADGRKDPALVRAFVAEARRGFARLRV